jgi:hypothetical protein
VRTSGSGLASALPACTTSATATLALSDETIFSFFLCDIVRLPFESNFTKVGVSRYIGTNGPEGAVKRHPEYEAAKTGEVPSAKRLAADMTAQATMDSIRYCRQPHRGHGLGEDGEAACIRRAGHAGTNYFLVDDFVGQGGTLANLRGYLIHGGGRVIGATTLTGRADSATLALQAGTLANLRLKHGEPIENWWQEVFGYRFDCLTESEARYLIRVEDADAIRTRLVAAGSQDND